jgi:hypothetical protein
MSEHVARIAALTGLAGLILDALNVRVSKYRFICYLVAGVGSFPFLAGHPSWSGWAAVGSATAAIVGVWRWGVLTPNRRSVWDWSATWRTGR